MTTLFRFSLLVAAVILAGSSFTRPRALADTPPADPNTIESLTPEQASALVAEFQGVKVRLEVEGLGSRTLQQCLTLNGLKSVDAETAKALASYDVGPIFLDGLTTLSTEAAVALVRHEGVLSLNGLNTLSDQAAKVLAQHKGMLLSLNGLTTLSDEAAKGLAGHRGGMLSLNGLTTLSDEAATALAQHRNVVVLHGLTTLSAAAARALARSNSDWLLLNGLTMLSD